MNPRQVQDVIDLTGIEHWGAGYFSIDSRGNVVCTPLGSQAGAIPLPEVIAQARQQGVVSPMIIRFPQIIKQQLGRMHEAFEHAIGEFGYRGQHFGVFPFKVNQRREFIDAIVDCGRDLGWGLEVGSKSEFMAALSYPIPPQALLICNGFKDAEFIDMAFIAQAMGKNVVVVVEGPDELELMIRQMERTGQECPGIGLRIRLYSRGAGKWARSTGQNSKFGLTPTELMRALRIISERDLQNKLTMLHFHVGSQVTAIRQFKNALREAARVFSKVVREGFAPRFLNIGGGVGVDYDGSQTSAQSSVNYSLQEFANDAVYVIGEVCADEDVAAPHIITESGRVIAAYHSVVVTDIKEVQGDEPLAAAEAALLAEDRSQLSKNILELEYILDNLSSKNFNEGYHDAVELHEDLFTLFNLGFLPLRERAIAADLFHKICLKALYFSSFQKHPPEEFAALQRLKVSKYLANFSIFQSIPDAWSIDQLFPILPLSRHDEKPSLKATIVDITCDSDGCIDQFVDRRREKATLDLHPPNGEPYYLGFFLVGAYQESLANEHNLFGAINEVEVVLGADGWQVSKTTPGDTVYELLDCRNYDGEAMTARYREQLWPAVVAGKTEEGSARRMLDRLAGYLRSYPYLKVDLEATTPL